MDETAPKGEQEPAAPVESSPSPYLPHAVQALRTAQRITLTLSQMADQKASILMGAAFVVFSHFDRPRARRPLAVVAHDPGGFRLPQLAAGGAGGDALGGAHGTGPG